LPGSAEAHLFSERIGYHPNSLKELLEILHGEPVITPDVDAFMTDYLDNYRTGSASARTALMLEALAAGRDPELPPTG
jgi:hypothetical protein